MWGRSIGERTTAARSGERTPAARSGERTTAARSGERTTTARSGERTTAARIGERMTAGLSSGLSTARGRSTDCRLSSRFSQSNDSGGMMGEILDKCPNGCNAD